MTSMLLVVVAALLVSVAGSLRRIVYILQNYRVVVEVPVGRDDGGGEPAERPEGKVVAFRSGTRR